MDAATWWARNEALKTIPAYEAAIQAILNTGRGNVDGSISLGPAGHSDSAQIRINTLQNIPAAQQLGRTVPLLHEILDVGAAAANASGGDAAPLPDPGFGDFDPRFAEAFGFDFSATEPDRLDEQFVFGSGPAQQQQQPGVEGTSTAQGKDERRDTRVNSQIGPGSQAPRSNAQGFTAPPPVGQQSTAASLGTLLGELHGGRPTWWNKTFG
ncbi:hypothetical protein B0A48_13459 [Cryoendolithus antarcticus]|uniref:Uncharacterized protein n=1 Tax=Cryoendolithus antarcticus TaxID=1507870 RepID=A0A1V8SPW9_9PEZI|nr:hypothetical protein B0A48_13459 [Cryoendolithus antarcticus]